MITDANQREYVIERPQATESNWRYRPLAAVEVRAANGINAAKPAIGLGTR